MPSTLCYALNTWLGRTLLVRGLSSARWPEKGGGVRGAGYCCLITDTSEKRKVNRKGEAKPTFNMGREETSTFEKVCGGLFSACYHSRVVE